MKALASVEWSELLHPDKNRKVLTLHILIDPDIIQTLIMNHQDEITWYCFLCHHTRTAVWSHFSRTRHESLLDVERSGLQTFLRSGCFVRSSGLWDSRGFWPGFPSFYLEENKPSLLSLIQLFPPLSTFLCKKLVVLNKITEEQNPNAMRSWLTKQLLGEHARLLLPALVYENIECSRCSRCTCYRCHSQNLLLYVLWNAIHHTNK